MNVSRSVTVSVFLASLALAATGCGKNSSGNMASDATLASLKNVRVSLEGASDSISAQKNALPPKTIATSKAELLGALAAISSSRSGASVDPMHQTMKIDQPGSPIQVDAAVDLDTQGNTKFSLKFSAITKEVQDKMDIPTLELSFSTSNGGGAFSMHGKSKTAGDISFDEKVESNDDHATDTVILKSSQGEADIVASMNKGDKEPKLTLNGNDLTDEQKKALQAEGQKIGAAVSGMIRAIGMASTASTNGGTTSEGTTTTSWGN